MIEKLIELDRDLFLILNGFHAAWLDPVMLFVSHKFTWIPLYALFLFWMYRHKGKQMWIYVIGIIVTIVIADQVTSSLMKPYFQRLRPSHDPLLESVIHIVDGYRGGKFGFASSHAANTFGLAIFLFLLLKDKMKWIGWIFLWAALVTYSRIYLGVHFPGDILVGGIVGVLAGWLCLVVCRRFDPKRTTAARG